MAHPTHADPPALSARQLVEIVALLATTPAFYLALLDAHRTVALALYALAAMAAAAVLAGEHRHRRHQARGRLAFLRRHRLAIALVAALAASAALPSGDSAGLIVVRLGAAALTILRLGESMRPWFWRSNLPSLLALAIAVLGLCGLGFWLLEPKALTFGQGLWLAFTTAATVGYGDIVPSTPASKIFAVFVVLLGFAVLSLVTAGIAAMWVKGEERAMERDFVAALHGQMQLLRDDVAALRRELAARGAEAPGPEPISQPRSPAPPR
jgi:voltage-gated potassium channel